MERKNIDRCRKLLLRFSDLDILKNIEGVYEGIRKVLPPHLDPLPKGERKRDFRFFDEKIIL